MSVCVSKDHCINLQQTTDTYNDTWMLPPPKMHLTTRLKNILKRQYTKSKSLPRSLTYNCYVQLMLSFSQYYTHLARILRMSSSQFLHCCCYHNCCHPKHASYNLPPHTLTRQYENHKAATKPNIQMLCPQISLSVSLSTIPHKFTTPQCLLMMLLVVVAPILDKRGTRIPCRMAIVMLSSVPFLLKSGTPSTSCEKN